jgi:exopolysaccharide biosynthesis protein
MKHLAFLLLLLCCISVHAKEYSVHRVNDSLIYEYSFDTDKVNVELVKALDGRMIGSEDVVSISKRNNAVAAINAGFYEYYGRLEGVPAVAFVSMGHGSVVSGRYPVIYITPDNRIGYTNTNAEVFLNICNIGKNESIKKTVAIAAHALNNPAHSPSGDRNDIIIYTTDYANRTLNHEGYEVVVDNNHVISTGNVNNLIPSGGFVISAHNKSSIRLLKASLKVGSNVSYSINFDGVKEEYRYLVAGSHIIVNDGIANDMRNNSSDFVNATGFVDGNHARTVVCSFSATHHAFFVIDNNSKSLYNMTISDINSAAKSAGYTTEQILKMSNGEILHFLQEKHKNVIQSNGMALAPLATWLRNHGCRYAINLDGGGSSTMVVNNIVVNSPNDHKHSISVDDKQLRLVSDAIILKKLY